MRLEPGEYVSLPLAMAGFELVRITITHSGGGQNPEGQ